MQVCKTMTFILFIQHTDIPAINTVHISDSLGRNSARLLWVISDSLGRNSVRLLWVISDSLGRNSVRLLWVISDSLGRNSARLRQLLWSLRVMLSQHMYSIAHVQQSFFQITHNSHFSGYFPRLHRLLCHCWRSSEQLLLQFNKQAIIVYVSSFCCHLVNRHTHTERHTDSFWPGILLAQPAKLHTGWCNAYRSRWPENVITRALGQHRSPR